MLEPVFLEGRYVRLEPLSREHHADLLPVALEPEIWRWTTERVGSAEDLSGYIDRALAMRGAGTALPFATVALEAGRAVGSTRFASWEPAHRRIEIGWTWIGAGWRRTAVNTEAKYLMLGHAFETLGCVRVELRTDVLNERSRTAILRLGAKEEGILRKHAITNDGRVRDDVYYSIIDDEWPSMKGRLEERLARAAE